MILLIDSVADTSRSGNCSGISKGEVVKFRSLIVGVVTNLSFEVGVWKVTVSDISRGPSFDSSTSRSIVSAGLFTFFKNFEGLLFDLNNWSIGLA